MPDINYGKFLLDMSFIGWEVVGILTFNLSKIFFSNPFKLATDTEFFAVYFEEYIRRSQVRIRDEVLSADDALYRDSIDFALLEFQKRIRNLRQRYDLCIFDLLVGQLFLQRRLLDGDLFAIEIRQRLVLACIFLTDKEGMLADEVAVGEIDGLLCRKS